MKQRNNWVWFLSVFLIAATCDLTKTIALRDAATAAEVPNLRGSQEVDGVVFKAIQASYNDFELILKRRKVEQKTATAKIPSDMSDYRIVVEQDQDNFYVHYYALDEDVLGGHTKYIVSKKTFKLVEKKYSK